MLQSAERSIHRSSEMPLGWCDPSSCAIEWGAPAIRLAVDELDHPLWIVYQNSSAPNQPNFGVLKRLPNTSPTQESDHIPIQAYVPAMNPQSLGDRSFCRDHGIRYPYVAGAMANGIASVDLVAAMGKAGMLGFFGSAGLSPAAISDAIDQLQSRLGKTPYGFNLIHSPHEPAVEAATVDLYLERGVKLIEASAFLGLTEPLVHYRIAGLQRDSAGEIEATNRIVAKVSRIEVARKFMAPAPQTMVQALLNQGRITSEQAEMARSVPVAHDVTAEADSGGHTDNRPALSLLPTMTSLRDQFQAEYQYTQPLRVGAAGGIATPTAAAAAFAMGAAYIVTGSINQACIESGSSDLVRTMLAMTEQADVTMAPAADMFEMGVKVQVLKRGTMFAMRAAKLFELYRAYNSIEQIPAAERQKLEKTMFRAPLDQIWQETRAYFLDRDPRQAERGDDDPKHRMALIFRWYLGFSSRWANSGTPDRQTDFQIWCGPSMGAFNEWAKGSYLEQVENRNVATLGRTILAGAAVTGRLNALKSQGVSLPSDQMTIRPMNQSELTRHVN